MGSDLRTNAGGATRMAVSFSVGRGSEVNAGGGSQGQTDERRKVTIVARKIVHSLVFLVVCM